MREGWRTAKLADLCEFRNGLWKGKKPPFVHVGVIRNTNFRADGSLDDSDIAFLDVEQKQFEKRSLQYGDLILEKSGGGPKQPVGRVVLFDKKDGLFSFSNFTSVIRVVDSARLDFNYLHRVLYWYYLSGTTESMQRRSTGIRNLEFSAYKALDIPLPPLPEQKRIVAILDEAFAGIATAVANTEKNLANARELFRTSLAIFFSQYRELPERLTASLLNDGPPDASGGPFSDGSFLAAKSSTRGRAETDRIIEGKLSLSVGMPSIKPRRGWRWTKLTNVARLESGHTPSRKRPEYWGGDIPWLGITDARAYHGRVIEDTEQHTNQLGIDNSAARILPAGTVCLSRTASVGYVVITGAAMATSQDFVNWVCSSELEPHFLKYLLQSEWRDFSRFSSGSVHQTIYFPEVKAFHICYPGLREQKRIVEFLDEMRANAASLESICQQKLNALAELKQALLHKAFSGDLTTTPRKEIETALA